MAKRSQGGVRHTVAKTDIFRDVRCGLELVFFGGGGNESQNRDILSRGTFYLTGTSQKLYMSTNTICEHNIPDILFLRSFNQILRVLPGEMLVICFSFYATNIPCSTVDYMYYM